MYDHQGQDQPVRVESRRQSPGALANDSKITFLSEMEETYRQTSQLDSVRMRKQLDLPFSKGQEVIKVDRNSGGSFMHVMLGSRSSSGTLGPPIARPSMETPFNCDEQSLMNLSSSPSILRASNITSYRDSDLLKGF